MKTYISAALLFAAALLCNDADAQGRSKNIRDRNRDVVYHNAPRPYQRSYPISYPPRRRSNISIIASLPFGAVAVNFGGRPYHYYNGAFYRPDPFGYYITTPPVGIVVPVLPNGSVSVMFGGRRCFYYSGVYYLPLGNTGYQVIDVPANVSNDADDEAESAANEYEKIVIDGKTYYKKGGTYYKAVIDDSGEVAYEAVGNAAD